MKVAFLHNGYESLGIEQLSAALKKAGHETRLVIDPSLFAEPGFWNSAALSRAFNLKKEALSALRAEKPDLVCFSVFTDTYRWALDWAGKIKAELGVPVVFGGIHPTSVPEKVIAESCVDHICVGEGDYALPALVRALAEKCSGPVDNIWSKQDGKLIKGRSAPPTNPDALEFADKELFYGRYPFYSGGYLIAASRGCPFACAYCANDIYSRLHNGEKYARKRSPGHVLAELALAKKRWKPGFVHFADEVFNWDRAWLWDFLERYKKEAALPFSCYVYPDLLDAQTARRLKEAGCFKVQMGVQTFNEGRRLETLGRASSNAKIAEAITLLKKEKIYTVCDSILGLPGETEEDLLGLAGFYAGHTPDQNEVFFLKYYPRTKLTLRAAESGLLGPRAVEELEEGRGQAGIINVPAKTSARLARWLRLLLILPLLPGALRKTAARNPRLFALAPGGLLLRILARLIKRPEYDFNTYRFTRLYRYFVWLKLKGLWKRERA